MSILNDIVSRTAKSIIKNQQQPEFPLKYDMAYGPYKPITSIEQSYKANFINLLLTSPGEWPMSPSLGVGLRNYLFEFPNSEKLQQLGPNIREQLKRNLPQVKLIDIAFHSEPGDIDNNRTKVTMAYTILGTMGFTTTFGISDSDIEKSAVDIIEHGGTRIQAADILNRSESLLSDIETL